MISLSPNRVPCQPAPRFAASDPQGEAYRQASREVSAVLKEECHALFFSFLLATTMYNFVGMETDLPTFTFNLMTQAKARGKAQSVGTMANTVSALTSALSETHLVQLAQKLSVPMDDLKAYREGVRGYCPANWQDKTFAIPAGDKTATVMKILLFVKSKGVDSQFKTAVQELLAPSDLAIQALGGVAACQLSDLNRVMG